MRSLAQFAMRGPVQASGLAALTTAVPLLFWIGASVVGLVILRMGIGQGMMVGLWALLPALGWSYFAQDPSALAVLLQVLVMATILRVSVSWEKALIGGGLVAIVSGLASPLLFPELLDQLATAGERVYEQLASQSGGELTPGSTEGLRYTMNASMIGAFYVTGVLLTMLARRWQAVLFNPGGFRQEFYGFRLSPVVAGLCALAVLAAQQLGPSLALVGWAGAIPLAVAGLAMVHCIVAQRGMSKGWLVAGYTALVLLSPALFLLLLMMAFVDSWLDFRKRIKPSGPAE